MSEEKRSKAIKELGASIELAQENYQKKKEQAIKEYAETISQAFNELVKATVPEDEE